MRCSSRAWLSRVSLGAACALLFLLPSGCASSNGRSGESAPSPPPTPVAAATEPAAKTKPPEAPAASTTAAADSSAAQATSDPAPGEPVSAETGDLREKPTVIPGPVNAEGPLDKEIIRRILRRHLDEFKECYLPVVAKRPELTGRVTVKFQISRDGQAHRATVEFSQLKHPGVEKCIVQVFRALQFPKPIGGGSVTATYSLLCSNGVPVPLDLNEMGE
jgi:outer membrane biosynthesis protein TonB